MHHLSKACSDFLNLFLVVLRSFGLTLRFCSFQAGARDCQIIFSSAFRVYSLKVHLCVQVLEGLVPLGLQHGQSGLQLLVQLLRQAKGQGLGPDITGTPLIPFNTERHHTTLPAASAPCNHRSSIPHGVLI